MKLEPEALLLADDAEAYRRFIEWSVGDGFDLAIIKMTAPVDRNALVAWTKEQVPGAREIDLKSIGPDGARLWDLLLAARDREQATMLVLYGLEESPSRPLILAQLNVERDELVKALALPWVLFVHPATYPALVDKAPDFVDFAGLWLDEVPRRDEPVTRLSVGTDSLLADGSELEFDNRVEDGDLLESAALALVQAQLDNTRDFLARYELRQGRPNRNEPEWGLALCLRALADNQLREALTLLQVEVLPTFDKLVPKHSRTMIYLIDLLRLRGQLSVALRLAYDYVLPAVERFNELHARAVALGSVAEILMLRGELDEALRIRREEQLPVFERLGDIRSRAVALGKIADLLTIRGELDEALRIRRDEQLPVYEELGDQRSKAVVLGKIADILWARGEVDEASRIRQEEQLPVYERLGDLRSKAIVMGKLADSLARRDNLEEALRIRRKEQLPVFERLGDVRSRAVTLGKIADLLAIRGELDEALRIRREEQLPILVQLGDVRSLLVARQKTAQLLAQRGQAEDRKEIETLLALALQDARRLRIPDAQTIEGIIRRMGRDPNAPPFA